MNEQVLRSKYLTERLSVAQIARHFGCSQSKINHWIKHFKIPKRTISDSIYVRNNPEGDPFQETRIDNIQKAELYGLGLGLYWGEGTKRDRYSVRLGNTNPKLIKKFIEFLREIYCIDEKKLKFGLQLFNDSNNDEALQFWCRELGAEKRQFQKIIISKVRGIGNYKIKSKYGVLTIYFNNKKLRDIICTKIENL